MHYHSRSIFAPIRQIMPLNLKTLMKTYNPILFDVSLRDGLQPLSAAVYPTARKMELFREIMAKSPAKIEVGSLVSPKMLPVLADSLEIHRNATKIAKLAEKNVNMYMLIPSIRKIEEALKNNVENMSFITSVSEQFQMKNVNKTLNATKQEFRQIETFVPDYVNKKLYISCVNECPIAGIIPTHEITKEIMHYWSQFQFDELCLSDTCGTLTATVFGEIVRDLKYMGMDMSVLSVHLHVGDENETVGIIHKCIEYGINKFDVSMVDTGGCSVTMGGGEIPKKMHANLSYELLERAFATSPS